MVKKNKYITNTQEQHMFTYLNQKYGLKVRIYIGITLIIIDIDY